MAATQQGVILGTAAYMSPEQAKGRTVDKRTDVRAFGCVLYEMLTGRQSFGASDVTESLAAVIRSEPQWDTLPTNLHPRLRETVERCLDKQVATRFQEIGDVKVDIQKVLADPSGAIVQPVAEVVQTAPQSKLQLVVGMLLTLIIGGVAVWLLQPSPAVPISRFDYELPEGVDFAPTGRQVVAISPDGRQFVYGATGGFYIRAMDGLEAQMIAGMGDATFVDPVFSPNGQEIAYTDGVTAGNRRRLMKIAVTGGAPIVLAEPVGDNFGISWETNGTIVYGQPDGIWQVSETGGTPVRLISTEAGEQAFGPQLLPGGEWVLFTLATTAGANRWEEADIVIESLSSSEGEFCDGAAATPGTFRPDTLFMPSKAGLLALPFDVDTLEPTGGPVSILQGVRRSSTRRINTGSTFYSFSDSGTLVYVPGTVDAVDARSALVMVDREGNAEPFTNDLREYRLPRVSPDGTRVAVEVADGRNDTHLDR